MGDGDCMDTGESVGVTGKATAGLGNGVGVYACAGEGESGYIPGMVVVGW